MMSKLPAIAITLMVLNLCVLGGCNRSKSNNGPEFSFTNMQRESGISFKHHPTNDSAKHYKPNHYDHGMGLLVADVDNDGLSDVYFLNQIGSNALYKNLGNGRFKDMTSASGTGVDGRVSVGGSFVDYDNDGDQDLFVTTIRGENVLFQNDGTGVFKDVTVGSGLEYQGHSTASIFFDFDKDGLLDLLLINVGRFTTNVFDPSGYYVGYDHSFLLFLNPNYSEKSILYRNLGNGKFKDVSAEMGLDLLGWNGDGSIADYNADGYPDLYLLNMEGDDQFFQNGGGVHFSEVTSTIFPKTGWGAMGIKFFDYNNDLLIDLMTTDMHSDMVKDFTEAEETMKLPQEFALNEMGDISNNILGNTFYKNLGNGNYQEVSDMIGVENYWPWGISVEDLNADGYQDVFIASGMGYPYRYGKNVLLINMGGEGFRHAEFELGIEPRTNGNIINDYFPLDCIGVDQNRRECAQDFNNGSNCLENGVCYKNGYVTATRSSRSSAIFDIDNDGDLDIITNEFGGSPQVLISDLAQKKNINYLKVKLVGTVSNKNAIGARVTIFYGDAKQVRYLDAKSGHLSQSQIPLYFGLGDSTTVDRIEVIWPRGGKQILEGNIAINTLMLVTESP